MGWAYFKGGRIFARLRYSHVATSTSVSNLCNTAVSLFLECPRGSTGSCLQYVTSYQVKDAVSSPAGTTIHGIQVLERAGFRAALMDALKMAKDRAEQLRQ